MLLQLDGSVHVQIGTCPSRQVGHEPHVYRDQSLLNCRIDARDDPRNNAVACVNQCFLAELNIPVPGWRQREPRPLGVQAPQRAPGWFLEPPADRLRRELAAGHLKSRSSH